MSSDSSQSSAIKNIKKSNLHLFPQTEESETMEDFKPPQSSNSQTPRIMNAPR